MDLSFLDSHIALAVMGICLCVGFVIKKSLDFIPNKYIPLIMLVLGTAINVLFNLKNLSEDVILTGMFSGLSSTGCYEAFKNLLSSKKQSGEEDKNE